MLGFSAGVFGVFLALLLSGVGVGIGAALTGMGILYITTGWDNMLLSVSWIAWLAINSFTLTSVPLYIFMGILLKESGVGSRIYLALEPLLNRLPGGLLYTNIIAGALFAACSGSSLASAATIGSVAFPEMDKRGYDPTMSAGSVGAGSILATIIPPSLLMIFYGSITEKSIGQLFIAGIIPGLIMTAMFIIYITIRYRFYGQWKRPELVPWGTAIVKSIDAWPVIALIVMVLGSIFVGIATPSEAAAIGSLGAVFLALLYRGLNWQVIRKATVETVVLTSVLMFIYVGCKIMSNALGRAGLVTYLTRAMIEFPVSPLVILLLVYLLFLIMGCFLEGIPMMLMIVPVVAPALETLGYDLIWFGVAVVLLCHIGGFTPPVGITLFVLQSLRPNRPITEIYWGLLPFGVIVFILLGIVTAFPQLSLFLLMVGR
jgi:tripartite ATP-independent transporter DctM subunit